MFNDIDMGITKSGRLNRKNTGINKRLPVKIIQFGEGNFLRAFVDYLINKLNSVTDFNAGVVVVQPLTDGMVDILNEQDGLYNLFMKGIQQGKEIQLKETISCIQKAYNPYKDYDSYLELAKEEELEFIFSNTTEAGIAFDENDTLNGYPHKSFPAKLTALLHKRFQHYQGNSNKGLFIIPCELINYNADNLKRIILQYAELWRLEREFVEWINHHNSFYNTLVDRIVPGYPKDDISNYQEELEFEDKLIVSAEVFLLWVIEGSEELKAKIPFHKIDENVLIVNDLQRYRTRKVRILNGAHTAMVPFSILFGNETVKETVDHEFTGEFIKAAVLEEINPTLPLTKEELDSFAEEVFDRFRNPFIKHQLSSIALNSISKFKVRVLPSIIEFHRKFNRLPLRLTFSFACLIRFYAGKWKGESLPVSDDEEVVAVMKEIWRENSYDDISEKVLGRIDFWDADLNQIYGLKEKIAYSLEMIDNKGIEGGYETFSQTFEVA